MEPLKTIGQILTGEHHRDAVHIAIAPVVAGERLSPGEHVGFLADGKVGTCESPIGIIDPFLTSAYVRKDQQCWLFLYPGSIVSLRHEWAHPAFGQAETVAVKDGKSNSEKWMRAWAMTHVSEDYYGDGETIDEESAYQFAIKIGRDMFIGPYEEARSYIDNEWWAHWEIITGESGRRGEYFACAC